MSSKRTEADAIAVVPGDEASIADLCRPLSARVLPRSALLAANGERLDPGRVIATMKRERAAGEPGSSPSRRA